MLKTETALDRQALRDAADDRDDIMALWFSLLEDTQASLVREVRAFLGGNVAVSTLSDNLVDILGGAHTSATTLGRRHAGVRGRESTVDDEAFAASVMDEQQPYLARMVGNLRDGRYAISEGPTADDPEAPPEGELTGGLEGRLQLYVNRLRGTANEAWVFSLPDEEVIHWILGGCDHCESCPELAANGPYTSATLPSYPGDGSTPCLSMCCCHLETGDGLTAFRLNPPV